MVAGGRVSRTAVGARERVLGVIAAALVLTGAGSVALFAFLGSRATEAAIVEQHEALTRVAVGAVEIGLETGRITSVRGFLEELARNPLFVGTEILDAEGTPMLAVPSGFRIPLDVLSRIRLAGGIELEDRSYRLEAITDEDGSVLGSVVSVVSLSPIRARVRRNLLTTLAWGCALLLPSVAALAWALAWLEGVLRRNEQELREMEKRLAVEEEQRRRQEEQAALREQLRQAQKMESLGTLAGGVAHDFNNLLTPIMGNIQLALDDWDEDARQGLHQALEASRRARDVVSQILMFSRRSSGEVRPVVLDGVIREVTGLVRASAPPDTRIVTELAPNVAVLANPTEIHQVVLNLATNAVHAMEGEGVLTLRLEERRRDGHREAWIAVEDTGGGIDPAVRERIFEPFFTTKGVGRGTGLGLSVVHGIVSQLGGRIDVDSTVGRGTTFLLKLPAVDEAPAASRPSEDSYRGRGERILLLDDEPGVRSVLARFLERLGYRVTAWGLAGDALAALRGDAGVDLVLVDHSMPDVTGPAFLEAAAAEGNLPPAILMSGDHAALESWSSSHLVVSVMTKPVELDGLARAVHGALNAVAVPG